jgi:hypothetical protein
MLLDDRFNQLHPGGNDGHGVASRPTASERRRWDSGRSGGRRTSTATRLISAVADSFATD